MLMKTAYMNVTQNVSVDQSESEKEPRETLPSDQMRVAAAEIPSGMVKRRTPMQSNVPAISTSDCTASVQITASTPPSME